MSEWKGASMLDDVAKINKIIEEHQTLRGHVKLVGDSLTDHEALAALERARYDWIPGQLGVLSERQKKLQRAVSFLEEGLRNHFAFEEKALPPLLGELLMDALAIEHREIKREIEKAKSIVTSTKLEGLSREELLSEEANIQQMISSLCHMVEEHANGEEIVLGMVQKALEEKG